MQHRELGDSGVEVSEVSFGAWTVGTDWWGDRSEADAIEMLRHAADRGITFFDTGDIYGHGRSEELVGEALGNRREEIAIGTKVGYDFYNNPQAGHGEIPKDITPDYLHEAVEQSLDRLGTDHVELLQIHNANVGEMDEDMFEALDELRESGTVKAVGWALGPSIGWLAEGDAAIENEFDVVQMVYNVFEQVPGQHFLDTIEELDADTTLLARVPHSSGILNEQVTPETELGKDDHRGFRPDAWYDTGWEKLDKLRFLERDGERTMGQAAIQWLLAHDTVSTVTPTFRSTDDIDEWAAAPDTPALSEEEFEQVADLHAREYDIERDDGMSGLRSSMNGADLDGVSATQADD